MGNAVSLTLFPTAYSLCRCHRGWWIPPTLWKTPTGCLCPIFLDPAKLIYNCRSHAKGDSQEFKIEEIEEF